MAKAIAVRVHGGGHYGARFYCPGCNDEHALPTKPYANGWDFNGDFDRPTFAPSILVQWNEANRGAHTSVKHTCHSFVRDGRIEFLGDCTHALAGQTVDLPELPDEACTANPTSEVKR